MTKLPVNTIFQNADTKHGLTLFEPVESAIERGERLE